MGTGIIKTKWEINENDELWNDQNKVGDKWEGWALKWSQKRGR